MDNEIKYLEELKQIDDEINPLLKKIATQIKEGEDTMVDKKLYEELRNKRKLIVKEYGEWRDKEILKRCIRKEDLLDGEWYETDKEGEQVARYCDKAQWIEKDNHFLVPGQQQFGMDGYMDYFGDVIHTRLAGFPPMKRIIN